MANYRIYLTQAAGKHIIKRLDANVQPAVYDGSEYGEYGLAGRLDFPAGVTSDGTYVYICDYANRRVMMFDSSLTLVNQYDTSLTVDKPYLIYYDSITTDLYILGVSFNFWNCKIERVNVDLSQQFHSIKISSTFLGKFKDGQMPTGICRGFIGNDFLICGTDNDILMTTETSNDFTTFMPQTIFNEESRRYMGIVHHSNGFLFLNDGSKILKVDSSFNNCGVSDEISRKSSYGLKVMVDSTLIVYDANSLSLLVYDTNLNLVHYVFRDSGSTIDLDAKSVMDFFELSL